MQRKAFSASEVTTCVLGQVQPLPRGSVPLDGALLLSFFLYSCVLISACILVGPSCSVFMKLVISHSAGFRVPLPKSDALMGQ